MNISKSLASWVGDKSSLVLPKISALFHICVQWLTQRCPFALGESAAPEVAVRWVKPTSPAWHSSSEVILRVNLHVRFENTMYTSWAVYFVHTLMFGGLFSCVVVLCLS